MAIAQDTESYVQEFAREFGRWQGRLDNLKRMAGPVAGSGRQEIEAGGRRMESLLKVARSLVDPTEAMTAEEWMEVHPRVTTALQALQSCYNNLMADWPSL
jgi:hypothetical protein